MSVARGTGGAARRRAGSPLGDYPEDDAHTFVTAGLTLALPGQSRTDTAYIAGRPGIYPFFCSLPAHAPMMRGELVVLRAGRRAVGRPAR